MDEYPIIDLSHLLPAAQGLARLPADERIQRLRADRWIGYPRAVEALNRLEALYAWPNKQRMPNLLLVGPTNNGKSMIVEKFRRTHPASSDADQEHIPVLVVQMPSEPSVIRFYVALLAAMGAPLRPRPRLPEMEQLALALLRKVDSAALLVDEVLPKVPLRQWVLSVPFQLRFLFASYPDLMGKALGIVYRSIATWLLRQAGFTHDTARTGAVTFIQRFGSALNLTRFHGVFAPNSHYRVTITPAKRGKGAGKVGTVHLAPEERTPLEQRAAMTWARRLKRVFNIDITECEKCQGPVKVIACIEDPVVIDKILNHLKAKEAKQVSPSTQLPPPRAPPLLPGWEQGLAD
ncbi:TPA: TniB family NTP-binding protein [Escherichia coli]|nr:TniB family NTP-binding protein [Escherichia coli]